MYARCASLASDSLNSHPHLVQLYHISLSLSPSLSATAHRHWCTIQCIGRARCVRRVRSMHRCPSHKRRFYIFHYYLSALRRWFKRLANTTTTTPTMATAAATIIASDEIPRVALILIFLNRSIFAAISFRLRPLIDRVLCSFPSFISFPKTRVVRRRRVSCRKKTTASHPTQHCIEWFFVWPPPPPLPSRSCCRLQITRHHCFVIFFVRLIWLLPLFAGPALDTKIRKKKKQNLEKLF